MEFLLFTIEVLSELKDCWWMRCDLGKSLRLIEAEKDDCVWGDCVNELVKLLGIEFEIELSKLSSRFAVSNSIVSARASFMLDFCVGVCLRRKGFGFGLKSDNNLLVSDETELGVSIVFAVGVEETSWSFEFVLVESLQKPCQI